MISGHYKSMNNMQSLSQSIRHLRLNHGIYLIIILFAVETAIPQEQIRQNGSLNIIMYNVDIEINDSTNFIKGSAGVKLLLLQDIDEIAIDLATKGSDGKGMVVDSVLKKGVPVEYRHEDNSLFFSAGENRTGDTLKYLIFYHGEPGDGLIISKNMYGDRTFFADNWPDRAHNWFPCADHPSDRALVDFTITAPSHYQVIATGLLQKRVNLPGKKTTHHWSSAVPVPTKVMVFAAAEFAVEFNGEINGIPYSNWVYPGNMEEGFGFFSVTPEVLDFFTNMIGPYPFEKMANVQSTTRYGGMENAGNIFYNEHTVANVKECRLTVVHEMAHQWFGNSVTETDWPHLWLSEGIATWLTDRYVEHNYGRQELNARLIKHRERIIEYTRTRLVPVVDFHPEKYTDLLNPNSYEKGSWILHMLRRKIGEDMLVGALVEFYDRYKLCNAGTDDFKKVLEEVSGRNLEEFFDDWLYSAGHPVLSLNTMSGNGRMTLEVVQMQQHKMAFTFPLDIRFVFHDGSSLDHTFDILFRRHEFIIDMDSEPAEILIDPDLWLLFEQR